MYSYHHHFRNDFSRSGLGTLTRARARSSAPCPLEKTTPNLPAWREVWPSTSTIANCSAPRLNVRVAAAPEAWVDPPAVP